MRLQHRIWRIQRVAWVFMGFLALAGILGLFGQGLYSTRESGTPSTPATIRYDTFVNREAPATLRIELHPSAVNGGVAQVSLNRPYTDSIRITSIHPQPVRVAATRDRWTFTFATPDSQAPGTLVFSYEPQKAGLIQGTLGIENGKEMKFWQFCWP